MNNILTNYNKNKSKVTFVFILYFSLLIGFFFNENSTGGAYLDYLNQKKISQDFAEDFYKTFFSFDKYSTRHSPILIIFLSFFEKINLNDIFIRLINLHICLLLPILFWLVLKEKFKKIDSYKLLLIAGLVFLSPIFRSLSVWPDSRIYGLIIFLISIYYFLKFEDDKKINNAIKCTFWCAISAYFSPNFALFAFFYFFKFFKYFLFKKEIFILAILNIILSLPAFIYIFLLESIFFFKSAIPGGNEDFKTVFNLSNKILIISSIIFFYLIPFLITQTLKINIKKLNVIITSLIVTIVCVNYFNYKFEYTGGGIFYHISNTLFGNNHLFYLLCLISLIYLLSIFLSNRESFIIFIILMLSNPQLTIYHKYYDPLIFILIFTIFKLNIDIKKIIKHKNLIILYIFHLSFLIINIIK
jgi:hypothetical protein